MDQSFAQSRRGFLRMGASAAAVSSLSGWNRPGDGPARTCWSSAEARDPWLGLKMGIATYTFSKLKTDAAIEGIKRVDLHYCSIKDAHLSLKSTKAERRGRSRRSFATPGSPR